MAQERTLKKVDRTNRPTNRIPVSGNRDILTIEGKEPGFRYRIVKDTRPGRVDKFLAAGYEIVLSNDVKVGDTGEKDVSEGSPVKVNLGRGEIGYLMRQKEEYYEEDQAAKDRELREREASMVKNAKQESSYGKLELEHRTDKV